MYIVNCTAHMQIIYSLSHRGIIFPTVKMQQIFKYYSIYCMTIYEHSSLWNLL